MEALSQRLGEGNYARRIKAEEHLKTHRGEGQNKGLFSLNRYMDFYGVIKKCLQLSGLWSRAVRNYLDIQVESNEVFLERLPAEFDGFRILQLTDLHADLHSGFVSAVRDAIATLEYDLVVVTGDFRTCTFGDHSGATSASIEILKDLQAPCYAVLGNHDFIIKVPTLESAGIHFLLNESAAIERGGATLYIVGIDDPNHYKTHDFERALTDVPDSACKVLLSHAPQTFLEASDLGFDLQLSGHTHGGQICLPGGYVLVHDNTVPRRLLSGAWKEGALQGYTSRGTGGCGQPVRLNCPAEVTLHTLRVGA